MTTTKAQREQARQNRMLAMSHPLRAKILLLLAERTAASPKELASLLEMPKEKVPHVSHHVKRLVEFDCAELIDERPVRGAVEHFYRATQRHLIATDEWDSLDPVTKTDLLCDFVEPGLGDFVASVRAGMVGSDDRFHLTRFRMVIDQEAKSKILEIKEQARLEIEAAHEEAANRIASTEGETIHFTSWIGGFDVPSPSR